MHTLHHHQQQQQQPLQYISGRRRWSLQSGGPRGTMMMCASPQTKLQCKMLVLLVSSQAHILMMCGCSQVRVMRTHVVGGLHSSPRAQQRLDHLQVPVPSSIMQEVPASLPARLVGAVSFNDMRSGRGPRLAVATFATPASRYVPAFGY
jgi:hypothetical protein